MPQILHMQFIKPFIFVLPLLILLATFIKVYNTFPLCLSLCRCVAQLHAVCCGPQLPVPAANLTVPLVLHWSRGARHWGGGGQIIFHLQGLCLDGFLSVWDQFFCSGLPIEWTSWAVSRRSGNPAGGLYSSGSAGLARLHSASIP